MTLGRSSSGSIKIKTDSAGGGLRAVECACCEPPTDCNSCKTEDVIHDLNISIPGYDIFQFGFYSGSCVAYIIGDATYGGIGNASVEPFVFVDIVNGKCRHFIDILVFIDPSIQEALCGNSCELFFSGYARYTGELDIGSNPIGTFSIPLNGFYDTPTDPLDPQYYPLPATTATLTIS